MYLQTQRYEKSARHRWHAQYDTVTRKSTPRRRSFRRAASHKRTVAALWQMSWFNGNGSTWDNRSVLARETLNTAPLPIRTCSWEWSDSEESRSVICFTGDWESAIVVTTELVGIVGDNLSVPNKLSSSWISFSWSCLGVCLYGQSW